MCPYKAFAPVMERIVTDESHHITGKIEQLRSPAN